ncbi:A disintegrin and metalloproteinase with thrombospondin motifs adt-1-like [Mercenaria mercenaria]|uniref:A disintegrin and metalloproteinase with thrombospondin motifs adt-1-like n=1 Tax=Mercenaria mercenaria TaxID=6596 RepID=UPI00234F184B|nr:A disintegrin and metalloproteinase with thrombospondin motifs adt-1-like [Mercenaria mercenaria]
MDVQTHLVCRKRPRKSSVFTINVLCSVNIYCVESLECYDCANTDSIDNCTSKSQCSDGQSCYLDTGSSGQFSLGCIENQKCGALPNNPPGIVGRDVNKRESQTCHECCSTDNCNKHLCEHFKPTTCVDNEKVDCAFMNTIANICLDIPHAKTICPKFCGLCSLVDGEWADWSVWSGCDVTCENGTQSRRRTCTNPAPAYGGLNCTGNKMETKVCHRELCPVHGGWTEWMDWEACSTTCDIGIQKRHRTCSNPVPDRFGDHCYGDTMDVRLCFPGPCTNGGWSSWGAWSSCTVTCSGGTKTRSRTCTHPRPSPLGKSCEGDTSQISGCGSEVCYIDNGHVWNNVTACYGSDDDCCRYQMQCTGETIIVLGKLMYGAKNRTPDCQYGISNCKETDKVAACCTYNSSDIFTPFNTNDFSAVLENCVGKSSCAGWARSLKTALFSSYAWMQYACVRDPDIAFNAFWVNDFGPIAGQTIVFTRIVMNDGEAYSNSIGEFTAPVDGIYSFSAQMCFISRDNLYFDIKVGNTTYASANASNSESFPCRVAQTVAHVVKHQKVIVQWTADTNTSDYIAQDSHIRNYFTGMLVHF